MFIVNFTSGTGQIRNRLNHLLEKLSEHDCLVTVFPIVPRKGLVSAKIINDSSFDYDCVLCCGGDGTLNHVINELKQNNLQVPLAYIPTGSTNDFSRSLTHGRAYSDTELALAAAEGDPFSYDLGRANGMYFNYVAAFGAFTAISYATPQDMKNSLGYFAYILNSLGHLTENLNYKVHMKIEHDGITEEGDYIFGAVSNSVSVAGIESPLLKGVELNDGLMEVSLIKAPENFTDISDIVTDLAAGKIQHENVQMFKTTHIRFTAERETAWTMDGEDGGSHSVMDIEVEPETITMMVPHRKAGR